MEVTKEIYLYIGKRTLELLNENKMSVYKLSKLSKLSNATIYNIIKNKNNTIYIETINNICTAFNITLAEFFKKLKEN